MDDDAAAELRALRSRAYGPDADLLDDAASARLVQLEAQLRAEREAQLPPIRSVASTPVDEDQRWTRPTTPPAAAGEPGPAAPLTGSPSATDVTESDADPATSRMWAVVRMLTSRLPPVATSIVAVTIAASVALTASIVWGLASIPVISQETGARQVATLEVDDDVEIPEGFFGTASEQAIAYEYYGLLIVHSSASSAFFGDGECLLAVDAENVTADGQGVSGSLYYGCRTGAFPATFVIALDGSVPQELRAQFPEGGALQFVLQDDRVGVFWDGGVADA